MSLPTPPRTTSLLSSKPPVPSAYPPSMKGRPRQPAKGAKRGALLNFLTAYLDSGFAFQISLFILAYWGHAHPFVSFEAQKGYIIILGSCLFFYFAIIPFAFRATVGRILLKKQLALTFVLGTAFLYFSSPPLMRSLKEIFYQAPFVFQGQKIMDQNFGAGKSEPLYMYFTTSGASVIYLVDGSTVSKLLLVPDGNRWKIDPASK